MITYVDGNVIDLVKTGQYSVFVHGCNCFNTMGSGVAKQVKEHFPEMYNADQLSTKGDITKLGDWTSALLNLSAEFSVTGINAYTQYNYGTDKQHFEYAALMSCLQLLNSETMQEHKIIMPKIGSGLGGGDWSLIEKCINYAMPRRDITVVNYKGD